MASPDGTRSSTTFTVLSAVESWDADFRWREQGELRDLTIDHTWTRVSQWLSGSGSTSSAFWASRFAEAFSRWQILPDAAVLQRAGTGLALGFDRPPMAVVNAAAFVHLDAQGRPQWDHVGLSLAAALAVRMLDNILLHSDTQPSRQQRIGLIGLIGLANALQHLNIAFDSLPAQGCAADCACTLLRSALQGAVQLSIERGGGHPVAARQLARWHQAGVDPELIDATRRHGLRALPSLRLYGATRLARLANDMAEGTDPVIAPPGHYRLHFPPNTSLHSAPSAPPTAHKLHAQLRLRRALRNWFETAADAPPLPAETPPSEMHWRSTVELAKQLGLPPPRWREIERSTLD